MRFSIQLTICVFVTAANLYAQEIELPSNPLRGRIEFEEKGCIECHSISGFGGTIAPDLGKEQYYGSFLELASIIWNHLPEMDRKYRQLKVERPNFTQDEMLNLIGFLYYLRYLGEPGSVAQGQRLLTTKGCMACHEVAGKGGHVGPDFGQIQQYASPLYIVQAMWNHGPAMQEEMKESQIDYPTLTGGNIVDISAYIRQAATGNTEIRMSPGNPVRGEAVFGEKSCQNCHSVDEKEEKVGPNLSEIDLKKSVTEIAGLMWNHSPTMIGYMNEESIEWPQFEGREMADLIAYLYFLGFEDTPGDLRLGEEVFIDKGCAGCHEEGGGLGPDLAILRRFGSPIRMIQLMWNHAPKMEDLLLSQNEEWPKLTTKEMQDLYAYLRSQLNKN
ncbi:MAG: c-type cytochrome [bacterium]